MLAPEKIAKAEKALRMLVDTVNVTGELVESDGCLVPNADHDWVDLAGPILPRAKR